jgi:tetratricopeptide (TPR) repeat protein
MAEIMRSAIGGRHVRWAAIGAAILMMAGTTAAEAQLALARSDERLLVLVPEPQQATDTSFAVEFTTELREELRKKLRQKLYVYSTERVCEVLEQSAYACDVVLSPVDADRLARAVKADAYMVGSLSHDGTTPIGSFRFVDLQRSGVAGWVEVRGAPGDSPRSYAQSVADTVDAVVKAAARVRECSERVNRGDFEDAKRRALRVFQEYPNHPAAAMCAELASEAMREPVDSQIVYVERAVVGDSLLARGWERLGRLYQSQSDTVQALNAFSRQSMIQATDRQLRTGVVAGAMTTNNYEIARELADEWLMRYSGDLEMMQLKARACVEGGIWDCALEALAQQYEVDTALVSDTVFYQQIIGAAQALGDTTAQLEWSARAVANAPDNRGLLRAHASALAVMGMTDSVLGIYDHLIELDPTDYRSALAGARLLLEDVVIDTAVPLDTASLLRGIGYLDQATQATQDTSVLMNVAVTYYQKGSALVQTRQAMPIAVDILEKAIANDLLRQLQTQAHFFLGYGLMMRIFEFDPEVTASESCELVEEEAAMVARGLEATEIGAEISPNAADQFRQQFVNFEQRIPTLRQAYGCQ